MEKPSNTNIGALIMAAGLSTRMGRPKMLLPWSWSTVIETVVNAYISAGIEEIVVVTGGTRHELEELLSILPVRLVFNPLFDNGEMLDSLKTGLRSFSPEIEAALIAPGDHPLIGVDEITKVLGVFSAASSPLIVPSYNMRRGHPWLVRRELWQELLEMKPPLTLRSFLHTHSKAISYVNIDNPSILMDMDTPEDYERMKKGK